MSNKLKQGERVECRTPFWTGEGTITAHWQDDETGRVLYGVRLDIGSFTIVSAEQIQPFGSVDHVDPMARKGHDYE